MFTIFSMIACFEMILIESVHADSRAEIMVLSDD